LWDPQVFVYFQSMLTHLYLSIFARICLSLSRKFEATNGRDFSHIFSLVEFLKEEAFDSDRQKTGPGSVYTFCE
jgi:hypothetical protein